MNLKLKESLNVAKEKYCHFMSEHVSDFYDNYAYKRRVEEIEIFSDIISQHFEFEEVNLIETGVSSNLSYGMFGFFLGAFVENFGGRMHSVDINSESCQQSEMIFGKEFPNLKYKSHCQDSVSYLERPSIIPNIVHLDSYNFELFDPFPSALHAWKEFTTIEKILPKNSIVFIDDNWLKGTHLQWFQYGEEFMEEIKFPIIGKGAHIYHEVISGNKNFELIGNHHLPYNMIKIYVKKK